MDGRCALATAAQVHDPDVKTLLGQPGGTSGLRSHEGVGGFLIGRSVLVKLACSSWSYHRALAADRFSLLGWIEYCADTLQLDGVEIEDKHIEDASPAGLASVRAAIKDEGLALANLTTFNDFGLESENALRSELDQVKRWVDHAALLEASSLRVFAGWPKGPRQAAWARMIPYLRQAAEYAQQRQIVLVLENHNHGGFIQTASDTQRALQQVNSPFLRPLLDTGNYLDGLVSVKQIVPQAQHVHAKLLRLDEQGRERDIDHDQILQWLREAGYQGFISVEYEGDEAERTAVPRGSGYLKRLLTA